VHPIVANLVYGLGAQMQGHRYCIILTIIFLNGCTTQFETSPSSVPVVPVEGVINSLKCGFAKALDQDVRRRSGLYGATAKVELDVNVVEGVDASGGISIGIPIYQGAGSLTPAFTFTRNETRSLNSSIDFDIDLRAKGTSICGASGGGLDQDAGFSGWIGGVVLGINRAVAGAPKAQMKQYVYESDFTVKVGGTFSAEGSLGPPVIISPIKVNTSVGSSRSDIQKMKITIDAVTIVRRNGKIETIPGGPRFNPQMRRGKFNLQ